MNSEAQTAFLPHHHNHKGCITYAMKNAEIICAERGLRFTRIRQQVLELIWANHRPVLAYDLLKQLRLEKRNAEPPTVYRALDFLLENGLVHKIESLNAYVGCDQPQRPHIGQFLICSNCNQVAELVDVELKRLIVEKVSDTGFKVDHQTVEISGRCPGCQQ